MIYILILGVIVIVVYIIIGHNNRLDFCNFLFYFLWGYRFFHTKFYLTKFLKANFNFIFSGKLRTFRQEINTHLEKHSHAHTYTYIYTLIKYFIDLLCFTVVVVVCCSIYSSYMDSCLRWQRTNERTTKFNNKTKDGKGYTNIYVCIKEKLSTCMWLLFLLLLHSKKSVRSDGDGTGNDGNDDNFFL